MPLHKNEIKGLIIIIIIVIFVERILDELKLV